MNHPLSLAHLTALDLPPPDLIRLAAQAGLDAVGLRLIRVTETSPGYPLMEDARLMRATKAALTETGLRVNDIEFVKIEPDMDVTALAPFLDAGAELGAREIITAPYDPDLTRLADRLGLLSEQAAGRGLGVSLEFFPWTVVPDVLAAMTLVSKAGPEVAILVDSLHFDRSGSTTEQLEAIPASRLRLAHLCDAPVTPPYSLDDLLYTAREMRLPPGEGQIDLPAFIRALPPDIPLGLEIPMTATRSNPHKVLKKIVADARALLADLAVSVPKFRDDQNT